jgi:outer membrane lipoprotein-sorting protein
MRLSSCLPAALMVLAATSSATAADTLAAVLARMDEAAAGFHSLSADVRKTSHTDVINEDTVDAGTLLVKRVKPHDTRYFIDFQAPPNPKKVLIGGHTAAIYYPTANRVEEYDLGKYHGAMEQFLLLGFGSNSKELESAYSIRLGGADTVGGQKTARIELIPKSKDVLANLTKVDLWISDDKGVAVQQKFYQPGGDYSLTTYTNIKLNQNIPDSAMRLDLPKNVQRQRPQK